MPEKDESKKGKPRMEKEQSGSAMNKMFQSAHKAALAAADNMWARTKVVRSRFPTPPKNSRHGSFTVAGSQNLASLLESEEAVYYDSMRDLWEEDIFKQPVAKDLPRLIRRVCVVSQDDEILFLPEGGLAPARRWPKHVEEADEECSTVSSSCEEEAAEITEDDEKDDEAALPRRSSRLLRWSRLRKRKSTPKEGDMSSNAAVVKLITEFVDVLAQRLEPAEERERIESELNVIRATVTESSEMQLVVKQIISAVGQESKIARVLKAIHQNIVLHSTVQIKTKLTMKYQTKDIRSADGWRIVVMLAKGYIQVAHIRREQSLDAFGNTKDHWEFEWEVRMTFDDRMNNMTAAQIRVTRLILGENMNEELAEELKSTLVDGLIVI